MLHYLFAALLGLAGAFLTANLYEIPWSGIMIWAFVSFAIACISLFLPGKSVWLFTLVCTVGSVVVMTFYRWQDFCILRRSLEEPNFLPFVSRTWSPFVLLLTYCLLLSLMVFFGQRNLAKNKLQNQQVNQLESNKTNHQG